MARKLTVSFALAGLVVACGGAARNSTPVSPDRAASSAIEIAADAQVAGRDLLDRRVGDVAVYRFSGTYRSDPITVTEEIRAREGNELVVDYALASGDETARFRVHRAVAGFEITSVARLEGNTEMPADRAEFEAWIEQTAFSADANVGRLSRKEETCLVGEVAHDCTVARYRVMVGDEPAILTVATSADLPGRDVGGVIEASDGGIIYRAELVELQRGSSPVAARAQR
jgi:hypothetical protein